MQRCHRAKKFILIVILMVVAASAAVAQTTAFSYQGSLNDGPNQANGSYDFEFLLFSHPTLPTQIGSTLTRSGVAVTDGAFSVSLDFGSNYPGANRFLEIRVRQTGGGTFTPLTPRQQINSAPYSVKSLNTDTATNATQLGGVAANQYVVTTDARMTDARNPLPGSTSYVQNTSVVQAASNFNVSGDGTVGGILRGNTVRATSGFFIGSNRVLGADGLVNLFAGTNAGLNNTGNSNAFFGANSGQLNTSGSSNSFFGASSGQVNTTGQSNSFFGNQAGNDNTSGSNNSFFGSLTGDANTTGADNSFFGTQSGSANTTGNNNSFFGRSSGILNTVGSFNSFFGRSAGFSNVGGSGNSFFGYFAGEANTTGFNNAFFGSETGVSNTTGEVNTFIGTGAGKDNTIGTANTFVGTAAGFNNIDGIQNTFIGRSAGRLNTGGDDNTFIGKDAGIINTTGSRNTVIGSGANLSSPTLFNATAIGSNAVVNRSNTIQIGRDDAQTGVDTVRVGALKFRFGILAQNDLCFADNDEDFYKGIGNCSSSARFKTNVETYTSGLNLVRLLRPVTFGWISGGTRDVGFIAEEVEQVEPLLATYNDNGDIQGVKYKQITTVLVNAVNEQQLQIERQKKEITELKEALCTLNQQLKLCSADQNETALEQAQK